VLDVPIEIGRDEAREAAARELSDPVYQAAEPSLFDRITRWLLDRLNDLFTGVSGVAPGGIGAVIVLVVLLVAVIVAIRLRTGPAARARRAAARPVFDTEVRTAAEYRAAADQAAASGDHATAIRERLRAVVRELVERGVLDEQRGRTVDEFAAQAGQALPSCADELRTAAVVFDEVVYGGRTATAAGYHTVSTVDDQVRATQARIATARTPE
jgi:hypothetical protein